jgi:prephenate dehydratase
VNATLHIGTLGSAATFAGEATRSMRALYPEFGEPAYFPSMDACWDALAGGKVDAVVLGAERTGQPHGCHAVITRGFYVFGEHALPLDCNLYVKPGARKEAIRLITGHGSVFQCTAWLDREFPGVPRQQHGLNSVEAAKAMMAGDGSMAVVGSRSLPQLVPGLETRASKIDDGAVASWWAVSKTPRYSDTPDRVVIASRCGADGQLGRLIAAVGATGFVLRTSAAFAVNHGVSVYDYLLSFGGTGRLKDLEKAIAGFANTRLAGAYVHRAA